MPCIDGLALPCLERLASSAWQQVPCAKRLASLQAGGSVATAVCTAAPQRLRIMRQNCKQ